MKEYLQFYIDGQWVDPTSPATIDVINPATEKAFARISAGGPADVDKAVKAARAAFESYSQTSVEERVALFEAILAKYDERFLEIAEAISNEMGAPIKFAQRAQAGSGKGHFKAMLKILKEFEFNSQEGDYLIRREPIGVCGLITPWNWPQNQIACKVAPALAAGCTMVLKPSEVAPIDAMIFAEVLHDAGVPAGVFNLVNGDGPNVGAAMSSHPDIDMMSFTGSTRAGVEVAKAAATTVKRVAQELGGKSPNIVLADADIEKAVKRGAYEVFSNTGQSCNAPTRMFVPAAMHDQACEIAARAAASYAPGDPTEETTRMGPVVSEVQFNKIQALIKKGIDEGAKLVAGGPGRPEGLPTGYFVQPTVFGGVTNDMVIAQEEIFGPVLTIIAYDSEEEAIAMANDTPYGLAGYVQSGDNDHALAVAAKIRAGNIFINGHGGSVFAPFGGYKQSGNGREWGEMGLEEFLEVKAVFLPAVA